MFMKKDTKKILITVIIIVWLIASATLFGYGLAIESLPILCGSGASFVIGAFVGLLVCWFLI